MPYQTLVLTASKRSPAAQQVDRLENARLAGAIRAIDIATLRMQQQLCALDTANILDAYVLKRHLCVCWRR